MVSNNQKVVDLYTNQKWSVMQISEKIGISRYAVIKILNSNGIQRRSASEAIRQLNITKFNKKEFSLRQNLGSSDESLKVAGAMLYWGEGTKHGNVVSFANSDPEMIQVFMAFLRRICGVHESRLRVCIHYYEDHDLKALTAFWSNVTGVPVTQFHKAHLHKKRETGTYRNSSVYGTVAVRYADSRLIEVITIWMMEYRTALLSEERPVSMTGRSSLSVSTL